MAGLKNRELSKTTFFLTILSFLVVLAIFFAIKVSQVRKGSSSGMNDEVGQKKPKIRVPLFVDPLLVRHRSRFRFSYDSIQALQSLRVSEGISRFFHGKTSCFSDILSYMRWVRGQWEPGRPDPYPPMDAVTMLREIRAGRTGGFCAQYNYLFVQGLQSMGMKARYSTIRNHEVTEVWVSALGKWVCFDPLYDSYYSDSKEIPLSVFEIHQRVLKGNRIDVIGSKSIPDMKKHLASFLSFSVWLKNDHVSLPINFMDIERYKVHFVDLLDDRGTLSPVSLSTPFPEDLYEPPEGE